MGISRDGMKLGCKSLKWLQTIVKKLKVKSLRSSIIWLFMPVIIVFVAITGMASYALARQQIEKNALTNIADTLSQTKNYLDNRLYDVFEQFIAFENYSETMALIKSASSDESWELREYDRLQMAENMDKIYSSYYSILDSILMYLNNGQIHLYKGYYPSSGANFIFEEWYSINNNSSYKWLNLHDDTLLINTKKQHRVASLFKLIGDSETKVNGIVLFNLKEEFFEKILNNPIISEHGYLTIVSNDEAMLFKNLESKYMINQTVIDYLNTRESQTGSFTFTKPGGIRMRVVYDTIKVSNWTLAAVFPEEEILEKANYIKYITFYLVLFLVFIAVVLLNLIARTITQPLTLLTQKVKKVEEGDMDILFNVTAANEIGVLNKNIGDLIKRIKELLKQFKEEQKHKRYAELQVLQAQINPHFLYNTLFSVIQLCDLGENKKASNMVNALSVFFRIGLSKGREIIRIEEEIQHIKNYLLIQQMKYEDDFRYFILVDDSILKCMIIKLTIQPLIENAIYHGVKKKRGQGKIIVKGYKEEDMIILEVEDNGAGMTTERLNELQQSLDTSDWNRNTLGFGVKNVHRRLKMHYGEKYGVEIESEKGKRTLVRVRIPYVKEGSVNDV